MRKIFKSFPLPLLIILISGNCYSGGDEISILQDELDMVLMDTYNPCFDQLESDINDDNNITYVNATRNDNSYTVLNITATGENAQLDRLTITSGHSNGDAGSPTESRYGGGIHKSANTISLTITNSKLIKNISKEAGGAMSAGFSGFSGAKSLTINNCQFSENMSAIGGVVYSANINSSTVTYSISNSLFSKNKVMDTNAAATGYAGSSMWLRSYGSGSTLVSNITNCTFVDNSDEGTASGMNNFNRTTLALTKNTSASHTANISNCIYFCIFYSSYNFFMIYYLGG